MKNDFSPHYHFYPLADTSGKPIDDLWKSREWLETDGLGGWSSAAVGSVPTRRYHSILMVNESWGRMNYVSQLEEFVQLRDAHIPLSSNIFSDVVHPTGYLSLFQVGIGPGFLSQYRIGDGVLTRELLKEEGAARTVIKYYWSGSEPLTLTITPLLSFRGFHSLQSARNNFKQEILRDGDGYQVKPYEGLPGIYFYSEQHEISEYFDWFYRLNYPEEKKRGLDYEEDLFSMLRFRIQLKPGGETSLVISRDRIVENISELALRVKNANIKRLQKISYPKGTPLWQLSRSARQCIIKTPRGRTGIVAGYHWFEEWGRDTFLSLPSLLSEFSSKEEVYQVFFDFVNSQKNGLIPNRFFGNEGDTEIAEYNSVDALLWLVIAASHVFKQYRDLDFVRAVYPVMASCMSQYAAGTDFGIRENAEGLLLAGDSRTQLTWMDARVNGVAVTPRHGAAVEICAAWYNAKKIMAEFSLVLGMENHASEFEKSAERTHKAFRNAFFIKNQSYLADFITFDSACGDMGQGSGTQDVSFRPNQLFAMSLPHPLLNVREARAVLFNVRDKLLTPYGLRTLSREHPSYKSHFQGSPETRDAAYHQGTVWPWLFIPYWDAIIKFAETDLRDEFERTIEGFMLHLKDGCLGSVSEVFDAEEPFAPGGTISQAWSIAAILASLRGISEGESPKKERNFNVY